MPSSCSCGVEEHLMFLTSSRVNSSADILASARLERAAAVHCGEVSSTRVSSSRRSNAEKFSNLPRYLISYRPRLRTPGRDKGLHEQES